MKIAKEDKNSRHIGFVLGHHHVVCEIQRPIVIDSELILKRKILLTNKGNGMH